MHAYLTNLQHVDQKRICQILKTRNVIYRNYWWDWVSPCWLSMLWVGYPTGIRHMFVCPNIILKSGCIQAFQTWMNGACNGEIQYFTMNKIKTLLCMSFNVLFVPKVFQKRYNLVLESHTHAFILFCLCIFVCIDEACLGHFGISDINSFYFGMFEYFGFWLRSWDIARDI